MPKTQYNRDEGKYQKLGRHLDKAQGTPSSRDPSDTRLHPEVVAHPEKGTPTLSVAGERRRDMPPRKSRSGMAMTRKHTR